jgi:uncharacterized Ntn-hydrolase superfamily protein
VAANFSVVSATLTPVQMTVDETINRGLVDMVDDSVRQLSNVNNTINDTLQGQTSSVKDQTNEVEEALTNLVGNLTETLDVIDFNGIKTTV